MSIVLIGTNNTALNKQVKKHLTHMGAIHNQQAADPDSLLRLARKTLPEYIILDPCSFGTNGLQVSKVLTREKIAPVIFIISHNGYRQSIEELIQKEAYALTYLTTPFTEEQLRSAITITLSTFKKINDLETKIIQLNETLAERKKVSKAKELLMKKKGWTEPQAHRYLQKQSMDTGKSLKAVAQQVINELF